MSVVSGFCELLTSAHVLRSFLMTLGVVGSFFIPFSSVKSESSEPNPIVIGGIFCLTGEIAQGCNAIREGAELAVAAINDDGGVKGRKIRLAIQDSQFTPKGAVASAKYFSSDEGVVAVLVTAILEAKYASPILEKKRVPYITLWDSAPAIEQLGDYSFGIGPWLPGSYELSADFATQELKAKRAGVIATVSEWSLGVAKGFKEYFTSNGGEVIAYQEVSPNEADFRSALLKILEKKPEVLYAPINGHFIPFFRQLGQLGYAGHVITSDNLTDELVQSAPEVFEGVYQTMVGEPDNDESRKLATLYERRFGKKPTMLAFHGWGYDGVRLIAEALRKGDVSRSAVQEGLLGLREFPGASGAISFSPEGTWRSPLRMFKVTSGRLTAALP